jgi:hypothetical protein
LEGRPREAGLPEVRVAEVGVGEDGRLLRPGRAVLVDRGVEVGTLEVDLLRMALEDGAVEAGAPEVGPAEVGASLARADATVQVVEVGAVEDRVLR